MALPDAKSAIDAGGLIIEVLGARANAPVTESDLRTWTDNYKIEKSSVMDPPSTGTTTLTAFGVRETCVIIDLRTMKIVEKVNGSTTGSGMSSVAQLLPKLLSRVLAK